MTLSSLTSASAAQRRATLNGIGMMLLSVAIFSLVNAVTKTMLTTYHPWQMFFIRGIAAMIVIVPFLPPNLLTMIRTLPRPGLQVLRVLFSVLDGLMFFTAVRYIPLADATTCYLAAPIFVTALSAIFLREQVGWRRWSAVAVGFAGVLIALRPSGATITWPAMIALGGCLCQSIFLILTRQVRGTPSSVLSLFQLFGSCGVGGMISLGAWVTPTWAVVLLIFATGIVNMCGMLCLNKSLHLAPASAVAPFQYTMIVWAILLGYLMFGDVPSLQTMLGAAIVTAAGIYIFFRERLVMRREPEPSPPPA